MMITNFNLFEYKLTTDNYSKYYYLVLRLDERTIENLLKLNIPDLKGISDSIKIIDSFFDIRPLMLVMKKDEVDKLNNLEKIIYDDVDYLTNDNFKILRRLYNVDDGYSNGSLLYQVIMRSNRHKYLKITNPIFLKLKRQFNSLNYTYLDILERNVHNFDFNVKTYSDLLNKSFNWFQKNKYDMISKDELDILLRYLIVNFGLCFENEGEILIKNKTFNIPEKSVLFIKKSHPESHKTESYEKLLSDTILNKIKNIYNVKILPYIKIINNRRLIDDSHKVSYGMIRYIDKMFNI